MPGMPLESLVQLGTVGDSDPAMDASCCVGDFVITLNDSKALPFVMGQVVDVDGDSGIVQWWHPGKSKEANLKAGRKKAILDLFGGWQPTTDIPVGELEPLPPSVVSPARIRIWGFTLDSGDQIPLSILDKVQGELDIDLTGLKMSSTQRGALYRAHRLMRTTG